MKCTRCGGIMNHEKIYCETEQCWGWSCISCGEYIDDVILENREWQKNSRDFSILVKSRSMSFNPKRSFLALQSRGGSHGHGENTHRRR